MRKKREAKQKNTVNDMATEMNREKEGVEKAFSKIFLALNS